MQLDEGGLWSESKRQSCSLMVVVVITIKRVENLATKFNLFVTTAKNIQTVVVVSIVIVAGLGWLAANYLTSIPWLLNSAIGLLGVMVGIIIATVFLRLAERNRVADGGFVVTDYEMIYTIDPQDYRKHTCTRKIKLKATKNSARLFMHNYDWSGGGEVRSRVESRGHRLLDDISIPEGDRCLVIFLGSHGRGDEVELQFTQELLDTRGHFNHALSRLIKLGQKSIKLTINLPRELDFEPRFIAEVAVRNSEPAWVRKELLTSNIVREGSSWSIESTCTKPRGGRVMLKWGWEGSY